jgi:ABC-type cobalamin/Fe3+-siderophores transport system ATPase subunit
MGLFGLKNIIGLICIPIITSFLNITINNMLINHTSNDIWSVMIVKAMYDYIYSIIYVKVVFVLSRHVCERLIIRLHMAKLKCIPVPGINQKQHKELTEDNVIKVRDFIEVIPIIWSTIITFGISIYRLETDSEYPVRLFFIILCLSTTALMTYLSDQSLYDKIQPIDNLITTVNDSTMVKMKLAFGHTLDESYSLKKRNKMDKEQELQRYFIIALNLILTFVSFREGKISQIQYFGNVMMMISVLSSTVKGIQYHSYMKELIELTLAFETYPYKCIEPIQQVKILNTVKLINASFGYMTDLTKSPKYTQKIFNLIYTFKRGHLYAIKGYNGVGKSTLCKMLTHNLQDGCILFNDINREHITFEDLNKLVLNMFQASEYTPKFTQKEINAHKGKDVWLEQQLLLSELFGKDTLEMSGGQKKLVFLYMMLTCDLTQLVCLDEILAELSPEEIKEVPEGGGILNRVINTLVNWPNLQNKIIIMIGHGITSIIPNKKNVIKLELKTQNNKTQLIICN